MILNVESFSLLGDIFNVNQIPDPLPTHTAAVYVTEETALFMFDTPQEIKIYT